jgi:hemoglobin
MLDPDRALYFRLGGYDAVAAFVDDLLGRLFRDPRLGPYWKGKCQHSLRKDRQLLVDFLCMATGGPVFYFGRDMKTSHAGLGIDATDWSVFMAHTTAVLDDLGAQDPEKSEVLALAAGWRDDIVERSAAAGER